MLYTDEVKLERLYATYADNHRLTRLYADLLNYAPQIITPEMMHALTADGSYTEEEAYTALLGSVLGLDDARPQDRVLLRQYLPQSVRRLDAARYYRDPYYRNIRIPQLDEGRWSLRQQIYPAYRAFIAADMLLAEDLTEIPPLGFFSEDFSFPAVLEDGNEWMTLTPVDLDTCTEAIAAAHGRVVTFGLGLGYYAYMVSEKDAVREITIVEKSEEVIALFRKHILPQFSHRNKIRIVCDDAFHYAEHVMPAKEYDVAFVDTWRDASDGAPMYRRMKQLEGLAPGTRFLYWIENFLISRLRAERLEAIRTHASPPPRSYREMVDGLMLPALLCP